MGDDEDSFDVKRLQLEPSIRYGNLELQRIMYSSEQLLIETPALLLDNMLYLEGPTGLNDFQTHILVRCVLPRPNRQFEAIFRKIQDHMTLSRECYCKPVQSILDGRFEFVAGITDKGVQCTITKDKEKLDIEAIKLHSSIKLLVCLEYLRTDVQKKESQFVWSVLHMVVLNEPATL